ncbi:MAG: acetylxylan esterase [Gammaproteobacteria bacterium]
MCLRTTMRKRLKSVTPRPKDFLDFWQKTRDELQEVPIGLEREPMSLDDPSELRLEHISFDSLMHGRIHGYFLRPANDGGCPLVIHAHGYGSCSSVQWEWGRAGFNVVGIDVRGYGRSAGALSNVSKWGYIMTGIESPETSALRGAVCDYLRAAQVGRRLLAPGARRTVFYGRSFGGALALMAEANARAADLLVLGVPSFGWAEGRYFFVKDGSGQQISTYLSAFTDHTEDVMLVLRYFDSIYFAELVRCPALVGIGLEDVVVPAKTVYPIVNHLGGPVELMEFPVSHTDRPEEKLWQAFETRWQTLAKQGTPNGDRGGIRH